MDDERKHKVDVLLKEYETLRQEVLVRTGHRFVLVSLAGGLMTFLITTKEWPVLVVGAGWTRAIFALVGTAALSMIWWRFQFLIERLGAGISRIERRINDLVDDAELLRWETIQESQRSESVLRKTMALLLRKST